MARATVGSFTLLALVGACLLRIPRIRSRGAGSDVLAENAFQYLKSSGQAVIVDIVREIVRRNGIWSITKSRSIPSASYTGRRELHQSRTSHDASSDTTYAVSPELGMFGKVHTMKGRYKPLVALATCAGSFRPGNTVVKSRRSPKFGRVLEVYEIQRGNLSNQESIVLEGFPELECLAGGSKDAVVGSSVQQMVALTPIDRDPAQFVMPAAMAKRQR